MTTLDEVNPDWGMMKAFMDSRDAVSANPPWAKQAAPRMARGWNPYSFEGGTIAGISGENFAVMASDTRMSSNQSAVLNRDNKKLFIQNDKVVFGGCMFYGDMVQLDKVLRSSAMRYEFDYHEEMSVDVMAEFLARSLYNRRFFPYYAWTVMGGIDAHGKGAVYSYDPIGCLERVPFVVAGNARNLIEPIMDNQVSWCTQDKSKAEKPPMTMERAEKLLSDAFVAASERETCTGDKIHIIIFEAGKKPVEKFIKLRED